MRGQLQLGVVRNMDDARIKKMMDAIRNQTQLNRDIWEFLPRLQGHLAAVHANSGGSLAVGVSP
jgi:hypothetical protein